MGELNKSKAYDLKGFVKAIMDMATKPQFIKHWIKETKTWRHKMSTNDKLGLSDDFSAKYTPKDKTKDTMILNSQDKKWEKVTEKKDGTK